MSKDKFPLAERMKMYEMRETDRKFMPRCPVYARVDGRSFSKFTNGLEKPYDERMVRCMVETCKYMVDQTNALIGYTQSDEFSLIWYTSDVDSQIWFNGRIFKMTSNLASIATVKFYQMVQELFPSEYAEKMPTFDCRVFQLPDKTEASNMILWREQDATKNAISSAAQSYFSHKKLQGLSGKQMQEMLFQKEGINFNDYPVFFKRGTFVRKVAVDRELTKKELDLIPKDRQPDGPVRRSEMVELEMPKFSSVENREAVIFDKADPIVIEK